MEKNKIKAEIIADSIDTHENRLTTFLVTFPRIILAELNTHRMFSRNSASSRAIPFDTMLDKVNNDPFIPIKWQKDHSGMQGTEYLSGRDIDLAIDRWLSARDKVVEQARYLNHNIGVTKQLANRLLEPFLWHTAIITATEWENFFALRAHEAAEIHIQDLAFKMLDIYNNSTPKQLKAGDWHIPFGDRINLPPTIPIDAGLSLEEGVQIRKVKIATARCARVSYLNYEGKDDYNADVKLHDRLSSMGHWSPFEHCAKVMTDSEYYGHHLVQGNGNPFDENGKEYFGVNGNFKGFIQYRKTFNNENKKDSRVIAK